MGHVHFEVVVVVLRICCFVVADCAIWDDFASSQKKGFQQRNRFDRTGFELRFPFVTEQVFGVPLYFYFFSLKPQP